MGFGHSHSKKKRLIRRIRSVTREAQHEPAHREGREHAGIAVRQGAWARYREAELGSKGWKEEVDRCLEFGLEVPSINDHTISTFARGELPRFAGINTFARIHHLENARKVSGDDAAIGDS